MTDLQPTASKREAHIERLRKKYPDKDFEDDEALFSQISDDYDEYENTLNEHDKMANSINEMFSADPRSAQFLADMHNGTDPVVGLVRNFGLEIKDVLDDPEMQDKIAEANKEYVERVAKSRQLDEDFEANLGQTLETLRNFQETRGLSDEEADAVVGHLLTIMADGVVGKFSEETLDMVCKAINYDQAVADANAEGEVAGRNAKIIEKYRKGNMGDGLAPLGGKNGTPAQSGDKNVFDLANEAL